MSAETPHVHDTEQEPLFPPQYLLILAGLGFIIALITYLTQPQFTIIGWGSLAIMVLALLGWALLAPDHLKAIVTGRTARYGGTAVLVTVVFMLALIAVYVVIRQQGWRTDLTESNDFSLTTESRQAVAALGADPTTPPIKLLAFYGANQAAQRDEDTVLLEDYQTTSAGKITYEFIDPVRDPVRAEQYSVTRPGVIVVVALDEAGEPDIENAETVNSFLQDQMTNAILKVAASGDFRGYVLSVTDGLQLIDTSGAGMSTLNDQLTDRFDWTTQQVAFFELTGDQSAIDLNDPAADGTVLIVPGGSDPLTDEELDFITEYVDGGGDLVLLASPSINEDNTSLATADNLSTYLYDNLGVRFRNDVVLDRTLAFQTPLAPVAITFDTSHFITSIFPQSSGMIFELPHSIEIAPTLPESVTVTTLASSGPDSYSKLDINALLEGGDIAQTDEDPRGPFPLGVAVEDSETGARIVLFGSTSIAANGYLGTGVVNIDAALRSLAWVTHFNDFFNEVNIVSDPSAQDTPVFADQQTIRNINFITVILLPFGVLVIGALVWWFGREQGAAPLTRDRGEATAAGD
jgi:hypothetical protein